MYVPGAVFRSIHVRRNAMLEQLKNRWEEILLTLKEEYDVTEPSFNTCLLPLKPYAVDKNVVRILVPDSSPHYIAIIKKI